MKNKNNLVDIEKYIIKLISKHPKILSGRKNYKDSYNKLSPVGSFRRSASGLFDLTGNVHEWMHDYYELLSFDVAKGIDEKDRIGPNFGSGHVIRGSSWRSSSLTELRLTYREKSDSGLDDLGFRLARWIGE